MVHGPLTPISEEDEQRNSRNFFELKAMEQTDGEEIQEEVEETETKRESEEEDEDDDFDIKSSAFQRTKTKKMVRNSK